MVFLLILIFIFIWVFSSLSFDRVIEYQYENYREQWIMDGKPRGMFFHPKGSSYFSFWLTCFTLHKDLPDWVKNDNNAIAIYKKLKFWNKATKYYLITLFPTLILIQYTKI